MTKDVKDNRQNITEYLNISTTGMQIQNTDKYMINGCFEPSIKEKLGQRMYNQTK